MFQSIPGPMMPKFYLVGDVAPPWAGRVGGDPHPARGKQLKLSKSMFCESKARCVKVFRILESPLFESEERMRSVPMRLGPVSPQCICPEVGGTRSDHC